MSELSYQCPEDNMLKPHLNNFLETKNFSL